MMMQTATEWTREIKAAWDKLEEVRELQADHGGGATPLSRKERRNTRPRTEQSGRPAGYRESTTYGMLHVSRPRCGGQSSEGTRDDDYQIGD